MNDIASSRAVVKSAVKTFRDCFNGLGRMTGAQVAVPLHRGGTRFNQGIVGIRAQCIVDVIVTSPTSWVKITGIT